MTVFTILVIAAFIGLAVVCTRVVSWLKWRGERVVRCPDNGRPAGVTVDAWHATRHLNLSACSRWPEKAGCGQACLAEIAVAPADCQVRTIAERWYDGKNCAVCGVKMSGAAWDSSQPGLIFPDHSTMQCNQISADQLGETLAAASPLCFRCYLADWLVRERPELAVMRGPH
ncbi:MAG TPA: hypothetical protein VKE70_24090 [Candidatus Solibacter sp.]|nr:hypothetical protein [Candidatus Solibacter sp.]